MGNVISYGPHLFSNTPELYVRIGNLKINSRDAHRNIKRTLDSAFSDDDGSILSQLSEKLNIEPNSHVNLSFMNHGNTQLVYLAKFDNDSKVAVSINHPHTPIGVVEREFDNLQRLSEIDSSFIVKPLAHFVSRDNGHEMYASEYIEDALCIAINGKHGVYDPFPISQFKYFPPEISRIVNSSMIALLVNYYDSENGKGLAETQISGNDFMLTRDFFEKPYSPHSNMKIIAARNFIKMPFDEYLDTLRQEFLIGTNRNDPKVMDGHIKINTSSKLPMTEREIENGINLGLKLRGRRGLF